MGLDCSRQIADSALQPGRLDEQGKRFSQVVRKTTTVRVFNGTGRNERTRTALGDVPSSELWKVKKGQHLVKTWDG